MFYSQNWKNQILQLFKVNISYFHPTLRVLTVVVCTLVTHLMSVCSVSGQTLTDRLFSSLSGGELFERITAEGYTMSEAEVINYMRQICEGVKHMHERNIIHLGE